MATAKEVTSPTTQDTSQRSISKNSLFSQLGPTSRFQVRSLTPGYGGFVPSIKAENMFAKTYGKTTYKSSTGEYNKGRDLPAEKKYVSMFGKEFVDQKKVLYDTAAKIVGVDKKEDTYRRPMDPNVTNKFWGIDKVDDQVVNKVGLEESKKAFYATDKNFTCTQSKKEQTREEALETFFGVPEKN